MKDYLKKFWNWLSSQGEINRPNKSSAEKLLLGIRVTAQCRFNAATRLRRHSTFSFFTTTILSLGLIFIPLMQNADIPLAFPSKVLNMISIFLAVSVLIYSIVIATARYDARADKLTQCGDNLKSLNRKLSKILENNDNINIEDFQVQYDSLIANTENHSDTDYLSSILSMKRDYRITGFSRFKKYVKLYLFLIIPYVLPVLLMLIEIIFILDMIGVSQFFTPHLIK